MDLRLNEIVPSLGHDWVNIVNVRLWLSQIDSICPKTQPWPINFFQWIMQMMSQPTAVAAYNVRHGQNFNEL